MGTATPRRSLANLLETVAASHYERMWAAFREAGFDDITPSHFVVLRYLTRHPGGARATTLAQSAGMAKQSMAYLLDYLEEHGYVTRRPDASDHRAALVLPTQRLMDSSALAIRVQAEAEETLAGRFGQKRVAEFRELLESIAPPAFYDTSSGEEQPTVRMILTGVKTRR
jgi:DNA-binding MarR family transcriptional regulator